MRVLVAYGSKMGGTAGLADMVAAELQSKGIQADSVPGRNIKDLQRYDAVIVGGALYTARWHADARRFVKRHRAALSRMPVWLFSSGPLDDTAVETEIPPVRFVRKTAESIGARGHATFGGRMPEEARGFPAASMARDNPGDWRDPEHVGQWARGVAEELQTVAAR